jgi:hypothetical protein
MLSPIELNDPRSVTPTGVAEWVRRGVPVYAEASAQPMLAPAGLVLQPGSNGRETVQAWFDHYGAHVLLLAAAPAHKLDPSWQSAVPAEVYKVLSAGGPAVAIFGTGPYAGATQANADPSLAQLDTRLQSVAHNNRTLPGIIELRSAASSGARITMDMGEIRSATAGVCVAAVDPELGSVVASITFGDGPDVETWRLDRVTLAAPSAALPTSSDSHLAMRRSMR